MRPCWGSFISPAKKPGNMSQRSLAGRTTQEISLSTRSWRLKSPPWTLTLCPDTSQPLLQTICTARYSPRVPLWLLREAVISERFSLELRRGQLRCQLWGAVAEPKRLVQLIELVAETLQRLRDLGLAEG